MIRLMSVIFTTLLLISIAWADEPVDVDIIPNEPVKGEVFQILFKCQTEGDVEPQISFEPVGFEVLGKQIQGLSTRTVYSGGQYKTTRELLISYDARASRSGPAALKNLVVKIKTQIERAPSVPFRIIDAPAEPKLVFVAAETSKKSPFVGEGIIVRYYVYTKTAIQAFDIKKYPKLSGFMKRYLQESENPQRVTVNGELFRRSVIYSVRLYPEKAGKLLVDPMDISATYAQDLYGNMGFGFGLGMRDMKTKLMSSEPLEIDVRPLPEANKPTSFTGLVGPHQFELKAGRGQVLVNEPLEVRLTVTGPGNLENLEAPVLWNVPQLEKFDAKADLSLTGTDGGVKTFDYTYLGKRGGEVPPVKLELSYFDPETNRYHVIEQTLPGVTVAGNANNDPAITSPKRTESDEPVNEAGAAAVAPLTASNRWWAQMGFWWTLLGLLCVGALYRQRNLISETLGSVRSSSDPDLQKISRGEFTMAELVRVLYRLSPDSPTVRQAVNSSKLSPDEKRYFLDLLDAAEVSEFQRARQSKKVAINATMLRGLRKNLKG